MKKEIEFSDEIVGKELYVRNQHSKLATDQRTGISVIRKKKKNSQILEVKYAQLVVL